MRITAGTNLSNVNEIDDLKRFTGIFASQVADLFNSNITFSDNVKANLLTFVFTGANKTVGVDHGLGVIPSGYLQAGSNAAASIFDGGQKNTITTLYLQSSAASTVRVLVFA